MKYFKPVFYLSLTLCISICIGSLASGFTSQDSPTEPVRAKAKVSETRQSKILVFSTIHSRCGHTTQYSDNTPVEFYSVNELAASFPSWEITGGDEKHLVFTRCNNDLCPEHYTARLTDDTVVVTSDYNNSVVYEFIINSTSLSKEDNTELKKGVRLSGKDALTSFIEDYTS